MSRTASRSRNGIFAIVRVSAMYAAGSTLLGRMLRFLGWTIAGAVVGLAAYFLLT